MSMCDRCRVSGCLLDYNGKACKSARKRECPDVVFTTADRIRAMDDESLAATIAEAQIVMAELMLREFGIDFSFPEKGKRKAVEAALKTLQQPWEDDDA